MAEVQIIPVDSDNASFKFRTDLEDIAYVLRLDWNERSERWHLDIFDADETPLKVGLPLNINSDIIGRFADTRLPPGLIMLYDTSGQNEEAGRDDLGDRCMLLYYTSEDEES